MAAHAAGAKGAKLCDLAAHAAGAKGAQIMSRANGKTWDNG